MSTSPHFVAPVSRRDFVAGSMTQAVTGALSSGEPVRVKIAKRTIGKRIAVNRYALKLIGSRKPFLIAWGLRQ